MLKLRAQNLTHRIAQLHVISLRVYLWGIGALVVVHVHHLHLVNYVDLVEIRVSNIHERTESFNCITDQVIQLEVLVKTHRKAYIHRLRIINAVQLIRTIK